MRLSFLILLVATHSIAFGQDFNHYKTLVPQGSIPKDFTELSSVKVASEITNITDRKARVKKAKKKFVLESTFSIDDFLASGSVLFNDEISVYLDRVLKEILQPYPDLQKKLRVYAVKSSSVNAFTTNNGLIFVNLGLLARLENEAQLAFVLSHEVVHYQKKHVMNAYVTNVEIDNSRDYRKLSLSEKGFAKSTFSKEREAEADLLGAEIYLKSKYAKDSVFQVFNILKLADFPLTTQKFNVNDFESGDYKFPDSLTKVEIKQIEINDDYDDSKSSHPNIKKRKEAIIEKLKNAQGGEDFIISKEKFLLVKKISQFELCRLYLLEHKFPEGLALSLDLQAKYPGSTYLKEIVAKSFYGSARKSFEYSLNINPEQWMGEGQRIASFYSKLSAYELSVLALRQLNQCKDASPDNQEVALMQMDLIKALGNNFPDASKNFKRTASDSSIPELKYPYTQYAFIDFKNRNDFFQTLDQESASKPKQLSRKKRKSVKAQPLHANKVVIVNPMYKKVDYRKRQKVRHIDSEKVLVNINDKINEAAGILNMKAEIINTNKMSSTQITLMQSNSILNDWIDEQRRSRDYKMISPIYNEVNELAAIHKTEHFAWMGGVAMRSRTTGKGRAILGALILPSMTPFAVAHLFSPKGRTLYFALVFNVKKQELEVADIRQIAMKDSESLLQSNIYYTLFKLKN